MQITTIYSPPRSFPRIPTFVGSSPHLKSNSQAQIQFRPTAELSKLSKATAIMFKRSTSTTMAKLINYNLYNSN